MNAITFQEDGHKYFNDSGIEVPSVSELLHHFGISNFSMVDSRVLEAASSFGSVVHQTCHLHDIDDLAESDPLVQPYLNQWIKFTNNAGFQAGYDLIEKSLYSKVWGYAGTPDRRYDNILIDIKTGQEALSHRIQTALYQILVEENLKIKIKERWAVYLREDDYKVVMHKDKTDISIAKSLAQIYAWKRREKLL